MVEGAALEKQYAPKGYRGFKSHPLRHVATNSNPAFNFGNQVAKIGRGLALLLLSPQQTANAWFAAGTLKLFNFFGGFLKPDIYSYANCRINYPKN